MKFLNKVGFKIFIITFLIILFSPQEQNLHAQKNDSIVASDPILGSETLQKNIENDILKLKLSGADDKIKRRELYIYFILALLIVVIVIATFAVLSFYKKAKSTINLCEIQNRELKLRENRIEELSLIINNINSSVLIASPDGKIEFINDYFRQLTGYSLEKLQENKLDTIVSESCSEEERKNFQEAVEKKESKKYTASFIDKTGKKLVFQRRLFTILDKEKNLIHLIANDYDHKWTTMN